MSAQNARVKQQISVLINKELHKKYIIHARNIDHTFTEWVTNALENQFKKDKKI